MTSISKNNITALIQFLGLGSAFLAFLFVVNNFIIFNFGAPGLLHTLYLGELYGCQFDCAGINLIPGKYHVTMNNGNILLKTSQGRELVIRSKLKASSFAPQSGMISLADDQLKEVCEHKYLIPYITNKSVDITNLKHKFQDISIASWYTICNNINKN